MVEKQSNGHLQNRLLAAIPPQAFSLFESGLRASPFKQGAIVQECMSSEHFGQLAWQFKRVSGSSGLKV
jgi:hypothetical protein